MASKGIASDLLKVDATKESDIDFTDNPPTFNDFWRDAKVLHKRQPVIGESSLAAPVSELEKEVWRVLEQSRNITKKIISREREGELVSQDLLNAQLRTCPKR
jgi:hypothetical protein